MVADVPIQTLCLPKINRKDIIEEWVLACLRILGIDFTEIKGIGITRTRDLASRLDNSSLCKLKYSCSEGILIPCGMPDEFPKCTFIEC